MSGFGIRALKKVTEEEQISKKKTYIKYIVYGENTFAILTFLKLHRKYPEQVKLICNNPFLKEDLIQEWLCTLPSVREEEVASAMTDLSPRFEVFKTKPEALFYKDTKFHKFGGRAKSHDLAEGEGFFTKAPYNINLQGMFDSEDFENLDNILKDHQLHRIIADIELVEPTDLIEKTFFKIYTGENEEFHCEKLYFCESPKKFLNLVKNKNMLADDVYKFAAGIEESQAISMHLKTDRQIFKKSGTVLVPQSMTHDWGSFIIDFEEYNPASQSQELTVLAFVGEEDLQEEDLAKKIRLMKRVLERVFPELSKAQITQNIRFNSEYRVSGTDDGQYENLQQSPVKFLGQAAPIQHAHADKFEYFSRGIYAIMSERF